MRVVLTSCEGSRCWYPRPGGLIEDVLLLICPIDHIALPGRLVVLFPFPFRYLIDGFLRVRLDRGCVTLILSVMNLYIYLGDFVVVLFAVEVFFLFDP